MHSAGREGAGGHGLTITEIIYSLSSDWKIVEEKYNSPTTVSKTIVWFYVFILEGL